MRADHRELLTRRAAGVLYATRGITLATWVAGHVRRRPAFPILTYHRVNDDADPFLPAMSTAVLDRHLNYVARAYRVLPLEEIVERAQKGSLPRNSLAITFDDGYRDNLTHAAPILSRYKLPSTVFLATGFIGTGMIPWFDRLAIGFKSTTAETVKTPWGTQFSLRGQAERLVALERATNHIKALADDELHRSVEALMETLDIPESAMPKVLMLDWNDVRTLTTLGFSVGAHTVNHVLLSRVSPDRAWTEIRDSRIAIEASLGSKPAAFAYPNGRSADYTRSTVELVQKAGFGCAVTTRFGVNTGQTPVYELRRGTPWEPDVATFSLKLAMYRAVHR
jgi:peptidoglycan/xylan/chitin deacetylase (PgdA/CDA1 family)